MSQVGKITQVDANGIAVQTVPEDARQVYLLSYGIDARDRLESIGLLDLLEGLRARLWLILGIATLVSAVGSAYAFLAPEWFKATSLVSPADSQIGTGIAGRVGGLGGLASLAGIDLGSDNREEPIAILRSRELAREFIEQNGLLQVILADRWDADRKQWKGRGAAEQPDIRDAVKVFDERVRMVQQDRKSGLVTVEMSWKDADMAAAWTNGYIEFANQRIRIRDMRESEARIEFLRKQIADESLVPMQLALGRLLEGEMQKLMFARVRQEYAFRVVDPATVPKHRSTPRRPKIVVLSIVGGIMIGTLFALLSIALGRLKGMKARTDLGS